LAVKNALAIWCARRMRGPGSWWNSSINTSAPFVGARAS
jgi:hypothetical protein